MLISPILVAYCVTLGSSAMCLLYSLNLIPRRVVNPDCAWRFRIDVSDDEFHSRTYTKAAGSLGNKSDTPLLRNDYPRPEIILDNTLCLKSSHVSPSAI